MTSTPTRSRAELALGAHVAIQLIDGDPSDAGWRFRLVRELTNATRIQSEHVVRILDHGFSMEGRGVVIMERLWGQDLERALEERGAAERERHDHLAWPMTPGEVAAIVVAACAGLGAGHALGVTHGDIQPSNVFLHEENGRIVVKLLNFGMTPQRQRGANRVDESAVLDVFASAPDAAYASPEQRAGRAVDLRSDLYSLACVAHRCLTRRLPTAGGAMEALPRVPASRSNPALPSALDAWFESMLVVDPDARLCQSAAALARTFVEAAGVSVQEVSADPVGSVAPGNEPRVAARPRSPPDARSGIRTEGSRARKSSEAVTRARRMTSVLGSTAFLITTGAILALWLRHSEDPRRAPQHAETSKLSASSDAAARTVAVYFAVTPDQARLMLDGQPINNPHSSFRPADAATHRLHAEAPGYQSIDRTIMLTRDITIELVLSPVAVASPAGDSPARALQPSPLPRPSLMARPVAPRGRAEAKPTKSALSVDRTNPWQDP